MSEGQKLTRRQTILGLIFLLIMLTLGGLGFTWQSKLFSDKTQLSFNQLNQPSNQTNLSSNQPQSASLPDSSISPDLSTNAGLSNLPDLSKSEPDLNTTVKPLVMTATVSGQTALNLLTNQAEIQTKQYDFGVFIESINGVKGDDQHFWALYVNDVKSNTGADSTILNKGDRVKWVWEKIDATVF